MKYKFRSANTQLFAYFIFLALFGSVVFQIPWLYRSGESSSYLDGLFTTVSAICVTGLATVDVSIYSSAGFVFLLLLIEAGGLGLVTFFTVYLAFPGRKISLINRNFIRDFFIGDDAVGARQILFRIIFVTLAIQTLGAIILSLQLARAGELNYAFYGAFLSVSAFCNAGFAPYSDNLHQFYNNPGICLTVCLLIIAGSLGFTVFSDICTRLFRMFCGKKTVALSLHTKIVLFMTVLLTTVGTLLFLAADRMNAFKDMTFSEALNNAFFQSVTLRTAGFETVSQSSFSAQSTIVSVLLMMIGGNPGSMAGGLKTTTVFLVWCYTFRNEEDRGNLSVFHRDISWSVLKKAVGVVTKAFCVFIIALFLLTITEQRALHDGIFSLSDLLFEVVSAFGTVGVSKGVTPLLSAGGKFIIIFSMLAGRTGVVALALGSSSDTSQKAVTDYPREDVLVG